MLTSQIHMEQVACPLGCSQGDNLVVSAPERLHGLPGNFHVMRCRQCGLMRTNPRPNMNSLHIYYPDNYGPYESTRVYAGSKTTGSSRWKTVLKKLVNANSQCMPPLTPGHLLEIGCASGAFLHAMAQKGWDVQGIEFSQKAADAARRLGHAVQVGTIESAADPQKPYDAIVGWMVFEHLQDPVQCLRKLHSWVKPGGWLVLSVPDAGSWEFTFFKDAWYSLSLPMHLFHFTPSTLRTVLSAGGWEVERIFWHNDPKNLFHSLRYRCLDRGWSRIGAVLLDIAEGRRFRLGRLLIGRMLGLLRSSGRMTVWARPV
jgi:2-polyprenyl-3-methyl-5-hydroxy-6-metoxy-1,4-benzoquinol methylase